MPLPRQPARYEPRTTRLKTILERCNKPSQTRDQNNMAQPTKSREERMMKSLPKHSVTEMVNENTKLERCNNPSQTSDQNNVTQSTLSREESMVESLPKHSVTEMVNEINRRDYSLTSDVFDNFDEYTTTPYENLPNAIDILQNAFPDTNKEISLNLTCDEEYFNSSSSSSEDEDFSSDDSVRDKNYIPGSSSSDESGDETATVVNTSQKNESRACIFKATNIIKRRYTTDIQNITDNPTTKKTNLNQRKRRNTIDLNFITTIDNSEGDSNDIGEKNDQHIDIPKRKKYDTSVSERNAQKNEEKRMQYQVKSGCDDKCRKKCTSLLTDEERQSINDKYWNLTWNERRLFMKLNVPVVVPKRQKTGQLLRAPRRTFFLNKDNDTKIEVCKIFFLTTLGFKKTNDKVLYNSISDEDLVDSRGKHTKTPAYDREILKQHVESFNPLEPHYRREHAPKRRYLPTDVTITFMHKDFLEKYPEWPLSYELYRQQVKDMNISFTQLGNEECETCENYNLHKKETSHDIQENLSDGCKTCTSFANHHEKYVAARKLYEEHKSKQDQNNLYFSGDLQKVIMLPRLDTFKKIIFCLRLATYNQTFAPIGKITSTIKPFAVLWHDALAGRKQEDIMSAFFALLLQHRDIKHIHIWLDNCSGQNKNWLLYFMLVHIVNSDYVGTESVTLYYFEPGHTFMSCDQFHHQVELAMKHKGKIYDFTDFSDSVGSANKGKVTVKSMLVEDFINVPNYISERRIQNSSPRVYLNSISQACFTRGCQDLSYKTDFKNDYQQLRFLSDKYLKNPSIVTFAKRTDPKGTDEKRKMEIINKCSELMPSHKLKFWCDLPESK